MRQLYVCSRPLPSEDNTLHRHLLGILSQNDNGEYQFEYRLGTENKTNSLLLPIFPKKDKIYKNNDARLLLDDYLPSEHDTAFMRDIMKKAGMTKYDEWEWLKTFESDDSNAETKLYETLPDDIIRHDEPNENSDTSNDASCMATSNESPFDDLSEEDYNIDETDLYSSENDTDDDIIDPLILDDEDLPDFFEANTINSNTSFFNDINNISAEQDTTDCKKKKTVIRTVTRTVKRTVKKDYDFIAPPPENPHDNILRRLKDTQEQRRHKLETQIKINS